MKKLFILILAALPFSGIAQKNCCSMSSTQQFAQLASNEVFNSSHLAPEPFTYTEEKGEMITYPCTDGKEAHAYLIKSSKPSVKWLFIFHEWWGLNDYIKREADRYAAEFPDVNVLALDLYEEKVAETPAVAQELMTGMKDERARSIINGAIQKAGTNSKIATIGWCMGGGWSLQASMLAGKHAAGCVMYYGMPEKDLSKLKNLQADVLGIFATKDQWINEEVVNQFKSDMEIAGKKITIKNYNADHAFANPSNPKFDKMASEDARKLVVSFLKIHLK